jgi:hypothetical protein
MGRYSHAMAHRSILTSLSYDTRGFDYIQIDPSIVQIGQIVQLEFSVESVPMNRTRPGAGMYQMSAKLRSLCIIDRKIQEVSISLSVV